MLTRLDRRRWIVLQLILMVTAFLSSFGTPPRLISASRNETRKPFRAAVYRFDTRTVFSCEEIAREVLRRPLVSMTMQSKDQWERIKADSQAFRSSDHTFPECLVQAGLIVL